MRAEVRVKRPALEFVWLARQQRLHDGAGDHAFESVGPLLANAVETIRQPRPLDPILADSFGSRISALTPDRCQAPSLWAASLQ